MNAFETVFESHKLELSWRTIKNWVDFSPTRVRLPLLILPFLFTLSSQLLELFSYMYDQNVW